MDNSSDIVELNEENKVRFQLNQGKFDEIDY